MIRPLIVSAVVLSSAAAFAADLSPRDLLPPGAAVVVELNQPARLYSHPVVRGAWREIEGSAELQRRIDAPEFDRIRQVKALLESAGGGDWLTAVDRLTTGGVAIALSARPGAGPDATLVVVSSDADLLRKAVDEFQNYLLARVPADKRPAALPTEMYRDVTCIRAGDAGFAIVGKAFLAATRIEVLRAAIDRLKASEFRSQPTENAALPLAQVRLDLAAMRQNSDISKALALPADDIGRVFVLGGWIDLLKRAETLTAGVSLGEKSIDLRLQLPAPRDQMTPGLNGFFASRDDARARPPLRIPGLIASASWYRDYGALWAGRNEVLTEAALKRLEEGNATAGKQLETVGARFLPSELLSELGPHFRIIAARQTQSVYNVDLPDKLPAAAILIELRSEAARQKLQPVLKFVGLIGAAVNNRMAMHTEKHKGFELASLRSREDADAQYRINRIRYQFSPTWGFARNHFLVGSTTEIVRQAIDALEAEAEHPGDQPSPFTTGMQLLSAREAAAALTDYRTALLDATTLNDGLSRSEAGHELDVLTRAIAALGTLSLQSGWIEKQFELRLRIGD